jgi:multiple sugar transport system permease protein
VKAPDGAGTISKAQSRAGFIFASPWIVGFLVFMAFPILASFYYSFCEYSVLKSPIWVGVENYRDLIHDEIFWQALWNTFYFAIPSVILGTLVAIGLALLLNAKVRGQAFYRTFFYLPSLVPQVALTVLWMWMFNGEDGIVNIAIGYVNKALNLALLPLHRHVTFKGPGWISDPAWTKNAVILLSLWTVGNAMVIYLAGLQDVPTELLEASDLDGAKPYDKFLHVTLPMISPIILFNVIMAIIGSMQIFTVPYIMFPQGVPAHSAYFYTSYLFDNAMIYHKMGYACAMGWIMFVIIFVLTLLSIKLSEKKVYYGGG